MGKTTKRNCSRKNKSMKNRKGGEGPFSSSENQVNQPVKEEQIQPPVPVEPTSNPAPKKGFLESITSFFSSSKSNPPSSTGGKKHKKSKRKSSKK